jgi:flavin reductase (DIM6/NTAB) family NADH-FMN oxidoreductase RutF
MPRLDMASRAGLFLDLMKSDGFQPVRVLDNFYQTSAYFPMPVVLVCTISETGRMNLGPYSLCFPYSVAGGRYQMVFNSRDNSNTGANLRRTGVCSLNFIPDSRRFMRNCVMLGYPGETTEEKMQNSIFTLIPSRRTAEERSVGVAYPDIVNEAIQVFECRLDSFEVDESIHSQRSILTIEKVLLKERWHRALLRGGTKRFGRHAVVPPLPVDYGFRNNVNFWFSRHSPPYVEQIPSSKAVSVDSVMWAISRGGYAEKLTWQPEAAAKLVTVPRVFLGLVLKGIADEAALKGVTTITPDFLDAVRDRKRGEKGR